jgi:hypothetical protein
LKENVSESAETKQGYNTEYIYAIIKLTGNSSSQGEYLLTVKYASF